jgi:signal transduction histidine kinase
MAVVERGKSSLNPAQVETLFLFDGHVSIGPGRVLQTGAQELITDVSDGVVHSIGLRPDEWQLAYGQKPSRYLCLPLAARGRVVGAMALLAADPQRLASEADLALARSLAGATAVAVANAEINREAQEANRLKDEFVAMVSHELRTPLTPILGCIHLLRTAKLSEAKFERALEMIERNAQTQVQIVEDLLDVSRMVAGKLHLMKTSTHLVPIVEAAVESLRPAAETKQLQVITKFDFIDRPIDADPDRLRQVIWNLLSNAVKFTPAEGRIEISVRRDQGTVLVEVTDTGIGIPADVLPVIFDRYRQSSEVNSRMRAGLGLGLAIVRHLVELHDGSVKVASAGPGRGTVFTLKFPFPALRAAGVAR